MRGKQVGAKADKLVGRIIPAHAGQTTISKKLRSEITDHPRACGANGCVSFLRHFRFGSSPRMRGKRQTRMHMASRPRIIPAHAGQTRLGVMSVGDGTDHPRACGANLLLRISFTPAFGSSPRMRGKPLGSGQRSQRRRIIPAHAGQTYVTSDGNNNGPDHPRACGANSLPMTFIIDRNGSSPRMRGKLGHVHDRAGEARIIPAHAGQTFRRSASCTRWPDHPRACGANACATSSDISRSGSSPRMRGKLELRKQPDGRVRIIPAHAGQTPTSPSEAPATSDHPRACGANPLSLSHRAVTPGSSPRMRGKLLA